MNTIVFYLVGLLAFSLALSTISVGRYKFLVKSVRIVVVLFSISFFGFWFSQKSINSFFEKSLSVQIVNRLNQPLDFYTIKVIDKNKNQYVTEHIGKIRPDYYQISYLDMANSDEFWVSGFLGKKNLVYFSQHSVLKKIGDQKIEVRNYLNQSQKLSNLAEKKIEQLHQVNIGQSVWITLCLLLLYLNIVLLFRKK